MDTPSHFIPATIFADCPLLVPYGTKIRLVSNNGDYDKVLFFAGYKTFDLGSIQDKYDLYPKFKLPTKDGKMSNRNCGWAGGACGYSNLEDFKFEILAFNDVVPFGVFNDSEKYNRLTSNQVAFYSIAMMCIAKQLGIRTLKFPDHPKTDAPSAIFDDADGTDKLLDITELDFSDENRIAIKTTDKNFTGYLDGLYGDYFNVAEALPRIFKAFCEAAGL